MNADPFGSRSTALVLVFFPGALCGFDLKCKTVNNLYDFLIFIPLTLIRSVLYSLEHFFLELFLNTDVLS